MAIYNVEYDLLKPGQNYDGLYDLLRQMGAVRALLSHWFVESNLTAVQIRDAVYSKLDTNDRVLVTEITQGAAWAFLNLMPPAGDWLKQRRQ